MLLPGSVLVLASLNCRKPQLFVAPTNDYAAVERVWGPQPWNVSLHELLRKQPRDLPMTRWESELSLDDLKSFRTR